MLDDDLILSIDNLQTHFGVRQTVKAVDGVRLQVRRGETVALVGESGSGKSVTSLSVMRLLSRPGRIVGGSMPFRRTSGEVVDLATASEKEMRRIRGREIAMIFQEPMTSLNPLLTVGDQIGEMISLHNDVSKSEARNRARQMLEHVEIPAAASRLDTYPHEMSGGMRQRVMIALALACEPALLIADEPTTALDVTIQAQILDLLRRLQKSNGMSVLFVTHNLGVVAEIAHSVAVMYAGRIVEQASVGDLFARPSHPYTRGLMACVPNAAIHRGSDGERRRMTPIPGDVPNLVSPPSGCAFHPRCPFAVDRCAAEPPPLETVGERHFSRCWRTKEI
jgi:peptide/nickel transport system ATP-binding protein